jgi:hypothetical protein
MSSQLIDARLVSTDAPDAPDAPDALDALALALLPDAAEDDPELHAARPLMAASPAVAPPSMTNLRLLMFASFIAFPFLILIA